ncbi:polymerase [Acidilutibacter cellobiosedens]|jgi:O-antigen ligase|uniref:Polymerase n=1 Tax=Acidilutibacter cellobiosedens TaxID=2507161 RepID=A0A410QA68_9FIRM|nr:O-antigen ligase family protein [Acidilutibacter cellobiosedens]MBE6081476.1 polymerase [Tissierellaceae bacterium]QAT60902.1 polymerase [Acidilutibacter cellobiosedens]
MVVEKIHKKELVLPIALGIIFSLIYFELPLKYFAALFMGTVVGILILHDIKIGIFLAPLFIPFLPDMAGLIYLIFIFAAFLYKGTFKRINPLTTNSIDTPIALFVIAITISTITSLNPMGSFRDFAIHISAIAFAFTVMNSIDNKKDLNILLTVMVFSATLIALYGFYQYKVGVKMEDKWLDMANNPGVTTRIFSVFGNPNILAEYLIMSTPVSIGLFWYNKRFYKKVMFLVTSLILMLALILTLSRGGWLGFAFGMLVFVLLVEKRLLLLLIPLGIGGVYLLPETIMNRIMSIGNLADSSNAYRIKIWKIAIDIIKDFPIAGVGFGYIPFKQVFETYIRTMPAYHAHNTYLETLAEMGIGGFIIFIILIFILYKYSIKKLIVNQKDRYIRTVSAGVLSGLSAILAHGAVENVLYLPKIIITFWFLVSFILVLMRISDKSVGLDR